MRCMVVLQVKRVRLRVRETARSMGADFWPISSRIRASFVLRNMFRIKALGSLTIVGGDGPLMGAASQPRRLAVLALLTRAGERGMTRDKIAACLWPDADEER